MPLTYNNRKALVTGAGRGIGKAIAKLLASEGVAVACVSKTENRCQSAANEILASGGEARAYAVDVSDEKAVSSAAKQILEDFGCVDILINNAGMAKDGLLLRMSAESWREVMDTNLTSCFYWTRKLAYPMARKRWGRIVNVSSVVGLTGNAGQCNYSSSKAGMLGLTKSLARELASRSITVNAVAPGFVETDMTSKLDDRTTDHILKNIPLRRLGSPDDIAQVVGFLCSEQASYITGQVFTVDGGMVM